jgi:hypothetical protein
MKDDKPFLKNKRWEVLPTTVKEIVERENEIFDQNLEKEFGSEILENLTLEQRSHRSKISRNENYSRFVLRISSLLIFLEDCSYMGTYT